MTLDLLQPAAPALRRHRRAALPALGGFCTAIALTLAAAVGAGPAAAQTPAARSLPEAPLVDAATRQLVTEVEAASDAAAGVAGVVRGPMRCTWAGGSITLDRREALDAATMRTIASAPQVFVFAHGLDIVAYGPTSQSQADAAWRRISDRVRSRVADAAICVPALDTLAGVGGEQDHLTRLFTALQLLRGPTSAPVVVAGHSMGGIYVKHAVVQSSLAMSTLAASRGMWGRPRLSAVYLATPHQGAVAATGAVVGGNIGAFAGDLACALLDSPDCGLNRAARQIAGLVDVPATRQLQAGSPFLLRLERDAVAVLTGDATNVLSVNGLGTADVVVTESANRTAMPRTRWTAIPGQTHSGFLDPQSTPGYAAWLDESLGLASSSR